jgi:signal-transduction protein with cAMP-binding, CBS, and nucleotidyltransferase domain
MRIDGLLKGHDLFRLLSFDEASEIRKFSSVKHFNTNEQIFQFNNISAHVYMLMEGSVYLRFPSKMQDLSLVITKIYKGEIFGLSPLLGSERYTATAVCNQESEVLSIEAKPFRELLKSNSQTGFIIMNQVAHIYFNRYINVLKNLQGVVDQVSLIN